MEKHLILTINPGSTSTKIAVFENEEALFSKKFSHTVQDLMAFEKIIDQTPFRTELIISCLEEESFDIKRLSAVVGRGGLLTPMKSGTYLINDEMVFFLKSSRFEHASNLGAILAREIADQINIPAYIVDPVVVDEMSDIAKVTGLPDIERISIFHALNQKAAAREAAKILGKKYEDSNLVVAHLGGGITVGAHNLGAVVDVNNGLNGDGPFTPERAGSIPAWSLIEMATSGRLNLNQMSKLLTGRGGLVAHLGTNDIEEINRRIQSGDKNAERILAAMVFNISKEIGAMATVLEGNVDAIVLTGGIAYNEDIIEQIRDRVAFLARIIVLPGEDEMRAMALGAGRVLNREEVPKIWHEGGNR